MAHIRFTTKDGEFMVEASADGTVKVLSFTPSTNRAAPMRGLGDAVARVTSAVGVKPCGGCKKRQEALNRLVPFGEQSPPAESQRPAGPTGG